MPAFQASMRLDFGSIEADVMKDCLTYLAISAVSYPFIALYNGGTALFRTMGNSKISMISSFIMNAINICFNALFIYGMQLGVFGTAIVLATITIVGQCVGAEDYNQGKYDIKTLMKIAYIFMLIFDGMMLLFGKQLISLYSLSGENIDITYRLLFLHTIFAITICCLAFTLPNAFRASNGARYTMIIFIASMWIFRIGLSYLLAKGLNQGVVGVWLAMFSDWAFRFFNFIIHYFRDKCMNKKPI